MQKDTASIIQKHTVGTMAKHITDSIEQTQHILKAVIPVFASEKENSNAIKQHIIEAIDSMMALLEEADRKTAGMKLLDKQLENELLETYKHQYLQYNWSEDAKHLAILYRDLWFHLYKKKLLYPLKISLFKENALPVLEEATKQNIYILQVISDSKIIEENQLKTWKHYDSPVPELNEQLNTLKEQIENIHILRAELADIERDFFVYKVEIKEYVDAYLNVLQNCLARVQKCQIPKDADAEKFKILQEAELPDYIHGIINADRSLKTIHNIGSLPDLYFADETDLNIPVDVEGGFLIVKKIDFKHQVNYWMDTEIMPLFSELHNICDTTYQKTYLTLSNAGVQISLLNILEGRENFDNETLSQVRNSLQALQNYIQSQIELAKEKERAILKLSEQNLHIQKVFDEKELFLSGETQLQIDAYSKSTRKLIARIPFDKIKSAYFNFLDKHIIYQDKDNDTASLLSFIDYHIIPTNRLNSIYLKKGFMGESYYVQRTKIKEKTDRALHLWRQNYQGGLLIYGTRLSGKSALIGSISHHPAYDTLNIHPGHVVEYQGNKFVVDYNLGKTLNNITKRLKKGERLMILIDDLTLWRDEQNDLYTNIQSLLKHIKTNNNIFFVVSINRWLKTQLDSQMRFSDAFSQLINTDIMERKHIVDALMKRYIASFYQDSYHPEEAEDVDQKSRLENKIRHCAKQCHNNIGATLHQWYLYSLKKEDADYVVIPRSFKKLIAIHSVLVGYLLKYKVTSEAFLSKHLGDLTVRSLQGNIATLLSNKILVRKMTGELILNEQLIHWVEETYVEVV